MMAIHLAGNLSADASAALWIFLSTHIMESMQGTIEALTSYIEHVLIERKRLIRTNHM